MRFLWLCLLPGLALAQPTPYPSASEPGRAHVLSAFYSEARPTLDGNVLTDPAWASAPTVSGFWQTTPNEGQPATEETEVRVFYTATTLYVGVVLYDREPARIIVSDTRRDASLPISSFTSRCTGRMEKRCTCLPGTLR